MNQVLEILPQIEYDGKGQRKKVLLAFEKQEKPSRPVEISKITGIPGPSVRRIIQDCVRFGQLEKKLNNKYSIIK